MRIIDMTVGGALRACQGKSARKRFHSDAARRTIACIPAGGNDRRWNS
jgi:hypothetical protein